MQHLTLPASGPLYEFSIFHNISVTYFTSQHSKVNFVTKQNTFSFCSFPWLMLQTVTTLLPRLWDCECEGTALYAWWWVIVVHFNWGEKYIILKPFCVLPRRQCSLCVKDLSLWHLDLPFKDDIFQNWHFFICFLEATKLSF